MNNKRKAPAFSKPFFKRFRSLVLSLIAAVVIGLFGSLTYILAYSIQYFGLEQLAWGVGQAILPESEVKKELAKLQSELHRANSKLSDFTLAISNARRLSRTGLASVSEGRARLANPNSSSSTTTEIKKNSRTKAASISPAQGGGDEEPVSLLDSLLNRLRGIQSKASQLESSSNASILQSTPIGAPVSGELTSYFGLRNSPFSGFRQTHQGIDIAMNRGAELFSTADGIVQVAGWGGAYGNYIILDHGVSTDGCRFETLYAHLSKIYVRSGTKIIRGERIGQVGSSGHSTGPHVHYEVRKDGIAVDPEPFVNLASLLD